MTTYQRIDNNNNNNNNNDNNNDNNDNDNEIELNTFSNDLQSSTIQYDSNPYSNRVDDDSTPTTTTTNDVSSSSNERLLSSSSSSSSKSSHPMNQLRYILTNAPLLRFFNSSNRYHSLNPPGAPVIHQQQQPHDGIDGVFSNLSAKPAVSRATEDGNSNLPTYEEASLDPIPLYWEATIMAGYEDEIFVDGLPVGNINKFIWNLMVSVTFQFIGFGISYLMHTSHATKNGSQAGLGITLITYGYSSIPIKYGGDNLNEDEDEYEFQNPNLIDFDNSNNNLIFSNSQIDKFDSNLPSLNNLENDSNVSNENNNNNGMSEKNIIIFCYGLIAIGGFLIIKAILDYLKAKKKENSILHPQVFTPAVEEV